MYKKIYEIECNKKSMRFRTYTYLLPGSGALYDSVQYKRCNFFKGYV
jgi:hypothetical protein